jgi:predicted transporter
MKMTNSKKKKLYVWFGILAILGLVEIFAKRALYARKQTTVLLSIFPDWVGLVALAVAIVAYVYVFTRPVNAEQMSEVSSSNIFNQKAPVKLVLLSLCVFLISSYVFGIILDALDTSSYPPLSQTKLVGVLALIPAVLFFRYFYKRSEKK